ncbi:MAG: IS630 family transposase [Actinobacteria bacterium]|nr:IS630 family transposase [Actinomycetota bacterium]
MWTLPPLEIKDEERAELERRVRAKTSTQRQAQRARVILLAADGVPSRQIAKVVCIHENYVGVWRKRFTTERLAGLEDRPRSGRPRKYGHDERLRIVATATSTRPEHASHWSHSLLANVLSDMGISASQVGRILAAMDIKPHQVRSWLSRPDDPTFWERAADVCGLYLSQPTNALVLSVDEKTAIPARSRKHPTKRATPGKAERQEFEYVRHGTACLMAALNVHTGEVLGKDVARNDSASFISFLEEIDAKTPAELTIHLVLDNGSSHVSKATKAWLGDHPRFEVHHTPKHASWLNQVELFLSIISRRLLRRGEFASRDELIAKIMGFIENYNRTAKPFRWTYDGTPLKAA